MKLKSVHQEEKWKMHTDLGFNDTFEQSLELGKRPQRKSEIILETNKKIKTQVPNIPDVVK